MIERTRLISYLLYGLFSAGMLGNFLFNFSKVTENAFITIKL